MAIDINNILMIYIPRNGCTCIPFKSLNEVGENQIVNDAREFKEIGEGKYDTFIQLKSKIDVNQFRKISIVRNPFTRAYSLYRKYLMIVELSQSDKSFIQFLNAIKNNQPLHPKCRGLYHKTQTHFLKDENNSFDLTLYRFESLHELSNDLGIGNFRSNRMHFDSAEEVISGLRLTGEGKEKNALRFMDSPKTYSTSDRTQAYSQECIDLVKEIYAEDFDNFSYSKNFEDII